MLKLKFVWNLATSYVTDSSLETIIFDPKEMIGILDLRSIGYYRIKQGILQQNLDKMKEKYPWLEPDNERRHMSDKEILDKYIDLDKPCVTDSE